MNTDKFCLLLLVLKQISYNFCLERYFLTSMFSAFLGLVGKIEQATHIDLNGDGRIGSGAPYH